jgi:asparagine synthase (glutamine-hydrolysing)
MVKKIGSIWVLNLIWIGGLIIGVEIWIKKMCGIYGIIGRDLFEREFESVAAFKGLGRLLHHRGPDGSGVFFDRNRGIALGHRRLSIQDTSQLGQQPMESQCGRFVVTYNGEIYNFVELRQKLEGMNCRFNSGSDTEVLVESISKLGIDQTISSLEGMFAFCCLDKIRNSVYLVRDRFGEKPLYYGTSRSGVIFASELKILMVSSSFEKKVDAHALASYFKYGYVPDPQCIFQKCNKVFPGEFVEIQMGAEGEILSQDRRIYWSLGEVARRSRLSKRDLSYDDSVSELDRLLRVSVGQQLRSDVPVGGFLSGGKDSSLIVAIMNDLTGGKAKSFTIGFEDSRYDESPDARGIAGVLGTEHYEQQMSSAKMMDLVDELPRFYDEPFGDSSQLPTMLVSRVARKEVTVCLSGDGGDELFSGYRRYEDAERFKRLEKCLGPLGSWSASKLIGAFSVAQWDRMLKLPPKKLLPQLLRERGGDRLYRIRDVLGKRNGRSAYMELITSYDRGRGLVLDSKPLDSILNSELVGIDNYCEWMMLVDSLSYLPGDILTKVDRAGMSCSLETRIPFLHRRLAEFAWSLPIDYRRRGSEGKRIVGDLLGRYVDKSLFDRPKMGFGVPLGDWFRGDLKQWAYYCLFESNVNLEVIVDREFLLRCWEEHINRVRDGSRYLWLVCMLVRWCEEYEVELSL